MKAVVQRVLSASMTIKSTRETRQIGPGMMTLLGIAPTDTSTEVDWLAEKLVGLRIFEDTDGKMNLSLAEVGGAMLIVSQFTLYGDARKGRRPSFTGAALHTLALPLYQAFVDAVKSRGIRVQTGEFGADMTVEIVNDGPVTLIVETP